MLPSTILQFWDLGGQRGIRNIWPKYYDDCHAVVYVIDADDRERLGEGWEVFGMFFAFPIILGWLIWRKHSRIGPFRATNPEYSPLAPREQAGLADEPFRRRDTA